MSSGGMSLEERKAQLKALREARELRERQLAAAAEASSTPPPPAASSSPAKAEGGEQHQNQLAASDEKKKLHPASKILTIDILPSSDTVAVTAAPPKASSSSSTIAKRYDQQTQTESDTNQRKKIDLSSSGDDDEDEPSAARHIDPGNEIVADRQASVASFTGRPQVALSAQRSLLERAMDLEAGGNSNSVAAGWRRHPHQDDDTLSNSSFSSSGGLGSSSSAAGESLLEKIATQNHTHLRVVDHFTPSSSSSLGSSSPPSSLSSSSPVTQVCFSPQTAGPLLAAAATAAGDIFVTHPTGSGSGASVVAKLHCSGRNRSSASSNHHSISSLLFLNVNPDLLAAGTAGGQLMLFDLRDRRGAPVCSSFPSMDGHSGEPILALIEPSLSASEAASGALRYAKSTSSAVAMASMARLVTVGSSTVCTWGIGDVVSRVAESSPLGQHSSSAALAVGGGGSSIIVPSSSVALVDEKNERPLHVSCAGAALLQQRLRVGARDGGVFSKPLEHFLELRGRRAKMERYQLADDAEENGADTSDKNTFDASSSGHFFLPISAVANNNSSGSCVAASMDGTLFFSNSGSKVVRSFEDALSSPAVGLRFCATDSTTSSSVVSVDLDGKICLWDMSAEDKGESDPLSLRHTLQLKSSSSTGGGGSILQPTCLDVDAQQMRLAAVGTRDGSVQFVSIPVAI